ncbi:MAG: hypothetical protein JKY36_05680 [Erythrobacter sp.]|nr:hypothetical protein [Erythrobacter sp.]
MVDMSQTIAPKSDQLNADDLIGGPRTITITRVTGNEGNAEQPVNVFFDGDNGKPFRPCKSMRRVMVKIWGADASKYPGNSMTIYRDPKVKWGGMEVGGIRISHMTGIDQKQTMALTESKQARKPYTVQPLKVEEKPQAVPDRGAADKIISTIARAPDAEKLDAYLKGEKVMAAIAGLTPELAGEVEEAANDKRASFQTVDELDDDPFAEAAE